MGEHEARAPGTACRSKPRLRRRRCACRARQHPLSRASSARPPHRRHSPSRTATRGAEARPHPLASRRRRSDPRRIRRATSTSRGRPCPWSCGLGDGFRLTLFVHGRNGARAEERGPDRGGRGCERRADDEGDVVPARERSEIVARLTARRLSVRDAARLASTANPSAPPIMNAVLTTPEARPASSGATSLIAARSTGFIAMPTPRPSTIMLGSTSTTKVPSTGARAKSASPRATSSIPVTSGGLMPNRITSLAESPSESAPMITVAGRKARPTSSAL